MFYEACRRVAAEIRRYKFLSGGNYNGIRQPFVSRPSTILGIMRTDEEPQIIISMPE